MALALHRLEEIPISFRGHDGPVNDVQFSFDGKHLLVLAMMATCCGG